ncbi:MAG TPA: hypothetical protein VM364_09350 [Vicinamibacterales bacterium]|nr:hypothetical protein [Vicinamibacterales bacterium]
MPLIVVLAVAAIAGVLPLATALPQDTEQPRSVRMEIRARVLDRDGRFVSDLTKDEVVVIDDGALLPLQDLALVGGGAATGEGRRGVRALPRRPHTWVLVFDLDGMDAGARARARTGVERFVSQRLPPGDSAAAPLDGERLGSGTAMPPGDLVRLLTQAEGMPSSSSRAAPEGPYLFDALERLATTLAATSGPKVVVLLSEGLKLTLEEVHASRHVMRRVADRLRAADATLYGIDTRGVAGPADAGMATLAADTGGLTIFNVNAVERALEEVAGDTREYYVCAYLRPPGAAAAGFREILIWAKRPGVTVRAPAGYLVER